MTRYIKIICLLPMFLSCEDKKSNPVDVIPDFFSGQVRLVAEKCCPPSCGVVAWANAQKFEVTKTDVSSLQGKTIVLMERCPEFLGEGFFKQGQTYTVTATKKIDSMYSVVGISDKETLPIYWSEKTEPLH